MAALAALSRQVVRHIKNCRDAYIRRVGQRFREQYDRGLFHDLLGPDVLFVPAPRSTPRVEDTLWPARRICEELVQRGLGAGTEALLERRLSVTKSALIHRGASRPSPAEHRRSLYCASRAAPTGRITIVDDVITRGSTLLGCAWAIADRLGTQAIRALAVVRTMSGQDIDEILAPVDDGRIRVHADAPRRDP